MRVQRRRLADGTRRTAKPYTTDDVRRLLSLLICVSAIITRIFANAEACELDGIEMVSPCRCCKMGCWYAIAKTATHELGHIPGQEGEQEALSTLKLIRGCMIAECAEICPRSNANKSGGGSRLFRPIRRVPLPPSLMPIKRAAMIAPQIMDE